MSKLHPHGQADNALEDILRAELMQGDQIIATARPILRQLLANNDQSLFSDEVIARIRGMIGHCARQLLHALAEAADTKEREAFIAEHEAALTAPLIEDSAFLVHAHTLVIEAQLAERLQQRSGIDSVLSPLLQELAASADPQLAALAMHVLAAQARFVQQLRRMEWPLAELPGDLFHKAMLALQTQGPGSAEMLAKAQNALRADYDESRHRVALITRMIMALDRLAVRALALDHAGLAIFATALGMASAQDRELAVMALCENQFARLALALRAAGLGQGEVEKQFLFVHPEIDLPPDFGHLSTARAAQLLAESDTEAVQ